MANAKIVSSVGPGGSGPSYVNPIKYLTDAAYGGKAAKLGTGTVGSDPSDATKLIGAGTSFLAQYHNGDHITIYPATVVGDGSISAAPAGGGFVGDPANGIYTPPGGLIFGIGTTFTAATGGAGTNGLQPGDTFYPLRTNNTEPESWPVNVVTSDTQFQALSQIYPQLGSGWPYPWFSLLPNTSIGGTDIYVMCNVAHGLSNGTGITLSGTGVSGLDGTAYTVVDANSNVQPASQPSMVFQLHNASALAYGWYTPQAETVTLTSGGAPVASVPPVTVTTTIHSSPGVLSITHGAMSNSALVSGTFPAFVTGLIINIGGVDCNVSSIVGSTVNLTAPYSGATSSTAAFYFPSAIAAFIRPHGFQVGDLIVSSGWSDSRLNSSFYVMAIGNQEWSTSLQFSIPSGVNNTYPLTATSLSGVIGAAWKYTPHPQKMTVQAVVDNTHITLTAAVSPTIAAGAAHWNTPDNRAAFIAACAAGSFEIPPGDYYLDNSPADQYPSAVAWNSATSYVIGNVMFYDLGTGFGNEWFIAIAPTLNVPPTAPNDANWNTISGVTEITNFSGSIIAHPNSRIIFTGPKWDGIYFNGGTIAKFKDWDIEALYRLQTPSAKEYTFQSTFHCERIDQLSITGFRTSAGMDNFLDIEFCTDPIVDDLQVRNTGGVVLLNECSGGVISNVDASDTNDFAIAVYNYGTTLDVMRGTVISNISMRNPGVGISVGNRRGISMSNVRIEGAFLSGIQVGQGNAGDNPGLVRMSNISLDNCCTSGSGLQRSGNIGALSIQDLYDVEINGLKINTTQSGHGISAYYTNGTGPGATRISLTDVTVVGAYNIGCYLTQIGDVQINGLSCENSGATNMWLGQCAINAKKLFSNNACLVFPLNPNQSHSAIVNSQCTSFYCDDVLVQDSQTTCQGYYWLDQQTVVGRISNVKVLISDVAHQLIPLSQGHGGGPSYDTFWVGLQGPIFYPTGLASVASNTTVQIMAQVTHVTGTATINTITAPAGSRHGDWLGLISDGGFTVGTSGNIATTATVATNHILWLAWDGTKWYFPVLFASGGSGVPTVADFGCVGNGSTNDTSNLQTAFNTVSAAGSSPVNGGALRIPSNFNLLFDTLNVPSNLMLFGDSQTSCRFTANSLQSYLFYFAPGTHDVTFKTFTVEGRVGDNVTSSLAATVHINYQVVSGNPDDSSLTTQTTFYFNSNAGSGEVFNLEFDRVKVIHSGGYIGYGYAGSNTFPGNISVHNCQFQNCRPSTFGVPSDYGYGGYNGGWLFSFNGTDSAWVGLYFYDNEFVGITGTCIWTHSQSNPGTYSRDLYVIGNTFIDTGLDCVQFLVVDGAILADNTSRRNGYVILDDTDTLPGGTEIATSNRVPKWIRNTSSPYSPSAPFTVIPVCWDGATACRNITYTGNVADCCNGQYSSLDGLGDSQVSTVDATSAFFSTDPLANTSNCGPSTLLGQNYCVGFDVNNSNNLAFGGEYVNFSGIKLFGFGYGAMNLYAWRHSSAKDILIIHPDNAPGSPVSIGNINLGGGPSYNGGTTPQYQRSYDNVFEADIHWNPSGGGNAVVEDAGARLFGSWTDSLGNTINDINLIRVDITGNINKFLKAASSSSGVEGIFQFDSVSAQATGIVSTRILTTGTDATSGTNWLFSLYRYINSGGTLMMYVSSTAMALNSSLGFQMGTGPVTVIDNALNFKGHSYSLTLSGGFVVIDSGSNSYFNSELVTSASTGVTLPRARWELVSPGGENYGIEALITQEVTQGDGPKLGFARNLGTGLSNYQQWQIGFQQDYTGVTNNPRLAILHGGGPGNYGMAGSYGTALMVFDPGGYVGVNMQPTGSYDVEIHTNLWVGNDITVLGSGINTTVLVASGVITSNGGFASSAGATFGSVTINGVFTVIDASANITGKAFFVNNGSIFTGGTSTFTDSSGHTWIFQGGLFISRS